MRDCDICGGSGTIRLPVFRRVSARVPSAVVAIRPEESYREYPCPECGPMVEESRVAIVQKTAHFEALAAGPEFLHHVRRGAVHAFADLLLRDNFLSVEIGKENSKTLLQPITVTLGVVSKSRVASMEERIAERQDAVAREVAASAIADIDVWGRDYEVTNIGKGQAKDSVIRALNAVLKRRAGN